MPTVTVPPASNAACEALLEQKFGMKPDMSGIVIGAPASLAAEIKGAPVPTLADIPGMGVFDFIHLFVKNAIDLEETLTKVSARLSGEGMLWLSFPKWSSPLFAGLTIEELREIALPIGLVDMKTRDVDDHWLGVKLVSRHAS